MIKKILIINPFGIGDVIFSTPLICALRKNFQHAYIGYMCNRRSSELISADPNINKIFVYEKDEYRSIWRDSRIDCVKKLLSFLLEIQKEKFDVSIDLSLGYQYSMFLKLLGVKTRLGFNYRNRGKFLTRKIAIDGFDDKHVIEHYFDILRLLDIDTKYCGKEPKIYVTGNGMKFADAVLADNKIMKNDLLIGMIPGCGASWGGDATYRRWGKKNFAILADRLIEKYGAKIILLGDRQEVDICKYIQDSMTNVIINYCGKTSIEDLVGIMARCNFIVTNDGGPLHMAIGLGVKTVSIFGPVNEAIYGPHPVSENHVVVSKKKLSCRPCYRQFKYSKCENRVCLNSIAVDEVLEAAERIIDNEV